MQDEHPKSSPSDAGSTQPVEPATNSLPLPNNVAIQTPLDDPAAKSGAETPTNPAWANDLRKLYDAVVEEPLPDSLIDLLAKLDAAD